MNKISSGSLLVEFSELFAVQSSFVFFHTSPFICVHRAAVLKLIAFKTPCTLKYYWEPQRAFVHMNISNDIYHIVSTNWELQYVLLIHLKIIIDPFHVTINSMLNKKAISHKTENTKKSNILFIFLKISLMSGLIEDNCFKYLLLQPVCCDVTYLESLWKPLLYSQKSENL